MLRAGRFPHCLLLLLVCLQGLGCARLLYGPLPERPTLPSGGMLPAEPAPKLAGPRARGHVFDDRDGDGIQGPDEPGLPGVGVSNGRDVVVTDAEGRYELPIPRLAASVHAEDPSQGAAAAREPVEDAAIFVIKPRGWRTRISEQGLPRFYYLHKPEGSPDADYSFRGVAPTGPLPASIDFPLVRHPEPDAFEVLAISDPQPYDEEQLAYYARDTVAEVAGSDAEFALVLGDLVGNDLALFEPLNQVQSLVGIPFYNVIGNHDLNFRSRDDANSDETWERVYGPSTYAFQVGPVHFAVLDDVIWGGFRGHIKSDGRTYNQNYAGGFREDQIEFLRNWLATVPEDELVVLSMHIPIEPETRDGERRPQRIFEVLSGHPHTLSLAGHRHRQDHRYFGAADGYRPKGGGEHHQYVVGAASGSWFRGAPDEEGIPHARMRDGGPKGYAVIRFEGARYSLRYKATRRPEDYQIHVEAPDSIGGGESAQVVVNVFNGGPRSEVEWRIRGVESPADPDAGGWVRLRRKRQVDPRYERLRLADHLWRAPWEPIPHGKETEHLWVGRLPVSLEPGAYWIEVRGRDAFGLDARGRRALRVVAPGDPPSSREEAD